MTPPLRIALLASARHPVAEPFAGGLEAHTWMLADGLRARGHKVTLFAGPGSDPRLGAKLLPVRWPSLTPAARADSSMVAPAVMAEHHAYLDVMLAMSDRRGSQYDVLHNNSLHYLPVAMAKASRAPVVTTLHTPPTPWLESAVQLNGRAKVSFVAVSRHTAGAWKLMAHDIAVILNGVDLDRWRPGPGGGPPVWFGRIVPEKGAHLAALAARRAGEELLLAGPVGDQAYFDTELAPLLDDRIRYLGHLRHAELVELVGRASCTLVTPRWDEPYGLVAAEALACATPVMGFDRGALHEVVDHHTGVLVRADDVDALATAFGRARRLSRIQARRRAEQHLSKQTMIDQYEALYRRLSTR